MQKNPNGKNERSRGQMVREYVLHDMAAKFGQLLACPREIRIIYGMKFLEATAYFLFAVVLVSYLSHDFGLSDRTAGWIYGCFGTTVSVLGLFMGFIIDNMGVRWTLMIAGVLLVIARAVVTAASATWLVTLTLLTGCSLGQALVNPCLTMALRRYTDDDVRQFAFSLFYVMQNISFAVGAFVIHGVRYAHSEREWHVSMYRVVLICGIGCSFFGMLLAIYVREIKSSTGGGVEEFIVRRASSYMISQEVLSQGKFWRFLAISVLFLGVMMNFHHMNVTFPKFYTRKFGADAPFELLLAINPILIIIMVPAITYVIERLDLEFGPILVFGSFISGISPFALAFSVSTEGAIIWMVLLSVGEAIWSPKLMELSVAIAPEGREGTYMSLTSAPLLLSKLGVGGLSGALLTEFCPEDGQCHARMMWFIIGCTTLPLTLLLALFRKQLFIPDDWERASQQHEDSRTFTLPIDNTSKKAINQTTSSYGSTGTTAPESSASAP